MGEHARPDTNDSRVDEEVSSERKSRGGRQVAARGPTASRRTAGPGGGPAHGTPTPTRTRVATEPALDPALTAFAEQLREQIGAQRVLLFGSRARGQTAGDSDYDLIVVSPRFATVEPPRRAIGLRQLWYEVGGQGPMDLICLTPEEFAEAQRRITLLAAVLPEAIDLLPHAAEGPR